MGVRSCDERAESTGAFRSALARCFRTRDGRRRDDGEKAQARRRAQGAVAEKAQEGEGRDEAAEGRERVQIRPGRDRHLHPARARRQPSGMRERDARLDGHAVRARPLSPSDAARSHRAQVHTLAGGRAARTLRPALSAGKGRPRRAVSVRSMHHRFPRARLGPDHRHEAQCVPHARARR